jgi:hypothetical protein
MRERRYLPWAMFAAVGLAALALRLAAGQGALWLDEAWSAQLARDARDVAGIFFRINHDNNHHLNTLWLQAVGWGADPRLARALAIASGTAAALVAASIGARRGLAAGAVAGGLFAVSPIMVTYGADARGYAPMLLAFLVAFAAVDRALASPQRPRSTLAITLAGLLGTLAHATMLFGLLALAGWSFLACLRRLPPPRAAAAALRLTGGGLFASAGVIALALVAGAGSPAGFRMGALEPFTFAGFVHGVGSMVGWTVGLPYAPAALAGIAALGAAAALAAVPALRPRAAFYVLALFALPAAVALLRLGNAGFARYYLISSAALLLLVAEAVAAGLGRPGGPRFAAGAGLLFLAAAAAWGDARVIANRHADPGEAIAVMAARAPRGTAVLAGGQRDLAVLAAAAATAGYPLDVRARSCPAPLFLFAERAENERLAPAVASCGALYRPVAARATRALSGLDWMLYQRAGPAAAAAARRP